MCLSSCGTSKSFESLSINVNPGMTKSEVINIMGTPENRQFKGSDEAWQWCNGGYNGGGSYTVIWFYKGIVTGTTSYKIYNCTACSDCFRTIKWGDKPDITIEFRNR